VGGLGAGGGDWGGGAVGFRAGGSPPITLTPEWGQTPALGAAHYIAVAVWIMAV
jgi:hypothetical protein